MVRSELASVLNEKLAAELQASEVELSVNCMLNQMAEALVALTRRRAPRKGRDPRTGKLLTWSLK